MCFGCMGAQLHTPNAVSLEPGAESVAPPGPGIQFSGLKSSNCKVRDEELFEGQKGFLSGSFSFKIEIQLKSVLFLLVLPGSSAGLDEQ